MSDDAKTNKNIRIARFILDHGCDATVTDDGVIASTTAVDRDGNGSLESELITSVRQAYDWLGY